ncbi:cytochrome P450 [Archangium sp.]|uniref:cytochrome P450 n=1 Tax=Archangium sp. TaxID=1872627 RepID=UPI002D5D4E25|nr:cytochrome P450 [Archangium sp.]HYO52790.1 cytochrome P450 [Archangium sp.]
MATTPGTRAVSLPGPRATPLLGATGNYIRFIADQLRWLTELSGYGPLVTLTRGTTRHLFIFHPDFNMQVLNNPALFHSLELWRTGPEDSSLRKLWTGLVTINGEVHKQHRRMMMPSFHKKKVESYRDEMVARIDRMLDSWKPGEVRDIFLEMRQVTLFIVTKVLFGLEDDRETLRMGLLMADWLERYTSPAVHLLPFDRPGLPYRNLLRVSEQGETAIRGLIARKRAQGAGGDDVLSMLLHARDEGGGSMSDAELVGQTNILFVAGHETTTNGLTWTLFLLDQHPEVHAALVEELEGELKGSPPTIEQLERLPLLDRVVKESLRILPPVPTAFRVSTAPFEMGGHSFDAETRMYYSPYVTHRLPDLYPEPDRFRPERWSRAEPPVYGYIPFSNGPRRCIGATLALLEIKLMLSMLLPRFRLSLPPGTRVDPMVRATLRPKGGLTMRIHAQDKHFERSEVRGKIRDIVALT